MLARRRSSLGFAIVWFFIHLAPTNSIVPRLDVVNDRQLYLAGVGFYLALAVGFCRLSSAWSTVRWTRLAAAGRYDDAERELKAALALRPDYPRARRNLAAIVAAR